MRALRVLKRTLKRADTFSLISRGSDTHVKVSANWLEAELNALAEAQASLLAVLAPAEHTAKAASEADTDAASAAASEEPSLPSGHVESSSAKQYSPSANALFQTPLTRIAEDMHDGILPSQVGGLDGGVAALQELNAFERIAESRIQDAIRNGEMNVSKKGPLEDRADLDSPEAIAAKVLGSANITPPWLQEDKKLRTRVSGLRGRLASGGAISEEEIEDVNTAIRRFNLSCPPQFQRRLFDGDRKKSADVSRPRAGGSREWATVERESLAVSLAEAGSGSSLATAGGWRLSHRLGDL
jgi:hypothetical protein